MIQMPLIALYNYDNTILDGLQAPHRSELDPSLEYVQNIPELSTDELHELLLAEIGELTVFYSRPDLLKSMITTWAKAERPNWIKLWQTTLFKYNPIWNKDGEYTESVKRAGGNSSRNENSSATTYGRSDAHNVTGYDTNAYSPDTQDVTSGTDSNRGGGTASAEYNDTETRTRTERGNIGIVTTQTMLKEEREAAVFNIYSHIIEAFKKRFCIMLY